MGVKTYQFPPRRTSVTRSVVVSAVILSAVILVGTVSVRIREGKMANIAGKAVESKVLGGNSGGSVDWRGDLSPCVGTLMSKNRNTEDVHYFLNRQRAEALTGKLRTFEAMIFSPGTKLPLLSFWSDEGEPAEVGLRVYNVQLTTVLCPSSLSRLSLKADEVLVVRYRARLTNSVGRLFLEEPLLLGYDIMTITEARERAEQAVPDYKDGAFGAFGPDGPLGGGGLEGLPEVIEH